MQIDARLDLIRRQPLRAKFRLRGRARAIVQLRGMPAVRGHAAEPFARRVAPAEPVKDTRQAPSRGHPVFVAQHATATCCRSCLERWHDVPRGHALEASEPAYATDVICRWIGRELAVPST